MQGVWVFPRTLSIAPSGRTLIPLAVLHAFAASGFLTALPLLLASGAIGLLAFSFLSLLWVRHARQNEFLRLEDDGLLTVFRDGVAVTARVTGSPTDAGWAVWLRWQEEGAWMTHARMLLRADFTQDDWRALGIWLRHRAVTAKRDAEQFSDAA